MAKVSAAWGIDIGQCALKALRCQTDPEHPDKVIGVAFDYIEYPKILSQPEADPVALVREALALFLSRNSVEGDRVAISVSGSSGLARFIKLPPVETKKIPDIVRYEANQQIPFDLNDVIWDYQRMYGGSEEEGFALETEVGLFAMKRDQVYQALEPFHQAGIEVDIVQLTPLALYNFIVFDRLGTLPAEDQFDPANPPDSVMALSLGTETTDLVITNGFRVWQRNVPIGGSHFTKALTKELKLTYAKAEHLKRNATQAEDPKAVYQAMRPVFKDLLTEIQRSLGFFNSLDKTAKIGKVVTLGNSMKLPGLKRYLSQNLGFDVTEVESLATLGGPVVAAAPAFRNNVLCFGVAYGLVLQGLGLGRLATNLVPVELVRQRIVRAKKPWALAASVLLAISAVVSFLILWWPWSEIRIGDKQDWRDAVQRVQDMDSETKKLITTYSSAQKGYADLKVHADALEARFNRRRDWTDLLSVVTQSLPHDPAGKEPPDLGLRQQIHVLDLRSQRFEDLSSWASPEVVRLYLADRMPAGADAAAAAPPANALPPSGAPNAAGYVVQIRGYHLHNDVLGDSGPDFVRRTLIRNLDSMMVRLPTGDARHSVIVPIRDVGITFPVIRFDSPPTPVEVVNPEALFDPAHPEIAPKPNAPKTLVLKRYEFVVQFAWQPHPLPAREGNHLAEGGVPGPEPALAKDRGYQALR